MSPGNLIYVIFLLGMILYWAGYIRPAGIVLSITFVSMSAIAFLPIGDWLIFPLEARIPKHKLPEQIDGIVVLSSGLHARATIERGQSQLNEQAERDFAFVNLAKKYPEAKLLYTGGSSRMAKPFYSGADAAVIFLKEQGFDTDRVIFDSDARNTVESAILGKQKLLPREDETWVLITTAWHMPRSIGVFCSAGWPVIPYQVDYRTQQDPKLDLNFDFAGHLEKLNVGVKEWIGLVAYRLTGKTDDLLPSGCN